VRLVLGAAALTLVVTTGASAHVTISPPFVESGVETAIAFETPNERPPHATTTLSLTAPPDIAIVSATAPPGWLATVNGSTVTWSGGRIEDRAAVTFPVRVRARVRAGTYSFAAVQRYDDGALVNWKAELSVLPATGAAAPKQQPWGAIAAALTGIVVIVASLAGLRLLQRRSLGKG
jgi:uncharacterized protein YcnI